MIEQLKTGSLAKIMWDIDYMVAVDPVAVGGVKGLARKVTAPAGTVVLIHEGTDDPSTRVDLSTNRPRKNCYYLLVQMPETGELVTLAAGCLEPVSAQAYA